MNAVPDRIAGFARILVQLCAALLAFYVLVALAATLFLLRDAWRLPAWRVHVQVHGHDVALPAASAIRLATSPLGGRWLDGRTVRTGYGELHFAWDRSKTTLAVQCRRCRVVAPAFGDRPLEIDSVTATVRRVDSHLGGVVRAGELAIGWHAQLDRDSLVAHFAVPETPLAGAYRVLASRVPEARRARIEGTFALEGSVRLPDGALQLHPRIDLRSVDGLGTAALRDGTIPGCGSARAVRSGRAWNRLREAAIAAEDQRFRAHGGYDLVELEASLARNLAGGRIERGASTITQQLARVVYTGADRDLPRKLRELLYAVEMERTLGKDRILDAYLAVAPWASGGCGAEAAAKAAFGRPLRALTTAQIARLAGGLRSADDVRDGWRAVRTVRSMRGIASEERRAALKELCAVRAYDGCPVPPGDAGRLAGAEPRVTVPRLAVLDSAWIPVDGEAPDDEDGSAAAEGVLEAAAPGAPLR